MKYAQFDPSAASPQPVIGWYDTDEFDYQNLPDDSDLLTLTQAQWDSRFNTPFVNGGTLVAAPILPAAQKKQIALLTQSYLTAISQPVSYTSAGGITKLFQADPSSISNLQNVTIGLAKAGDTPPGFYWMAADNTQVPFTYADLQGLAEAILIQGWTAFQHLQSQKAAVGVATTLTDVESVVW